MISIIIPVYNVEHFLHQCVNSVLAQSYDNIEVLLINDGSTDNSGQICDQIARQNKKVKVFHKENGGVSSARNLGLREAKGDFIGFVDSDDWIEPNMYEEMLSNLLNTNSQMCICSKYIRGNNILNNSNIASRSIRREEGIKAILDYNFPSSIWTSLYKKGILVNIFLNEKIHHLEDFEFQLRVLNKTERIAICTTPYYHYRNREGSANNSGFNSKVLSCLEIVPVVERILRNDNMISNRYISAVKSRMTLVVSSFMARTKFQEKNLEEKMENNARTALLDTVLTNVPVKKKILILLLSISYRLYASFYRLIK